MFMENGSKIVYLDKRRTTTGQGALVQALLDEYGPFLDRFLRMRLVPVDERDDLLQELSIRLIRADNLADIYAEGQAAVRAYLITIITNYLRDQHRRSVVRMASFHDSYDQETIVLEDARSPEMCVAARQELDTIKTVLQDQHPKFRKAFILSRMHSKSYSQIAKEMEVSVSMVEKYISTVLGHIRAALSPKIDSDKRS